MIQKMPQTDISQLQEFIKLKEHKKPDDSILLEIELNNPKKLNVLNLEMILTLNKAVRKWQDREELSVVFIHSAGDRAFCAGGDVAQIYSTILESKKRKKDPALATKSFFQKEYETDYILSHFPKPVVLWGNGIVMGGGMGLFMSSSHPIATETSILAMPEINIGFFPDVGASYFLTQIKEGVGKYLALTACRLNAVEARYLDLTKWLCLNEDKKKVFDFLLDVSFKHKEEFNDKFEGFYRQISSPLAQNNWIKNFQKEITSALEFKSLESFYDYFSQLKLDDKTWEQNRQNFLKASPTSLAVVFEQFKRARNQDKKSLFEMELTIAMNKACNADFPEGVRALLVDKTKDPKWKPSRIDDLDPLEVSKYFQASEDRDCFLGV